jgi:hypothetical protein
VKVVRSSLEVTIFLHLFFHVRRFGNSPPRLPSIHAKIILSKELRSKQHVSDDMVNRFAFDSGFLFGTLSLVGITKFLVVILYTHIYDMFPILCLVAQTEDD